MSFDDLIPLTLSRTDRAPAQDGLQITSLNGVHYARADAPGSYYSHSLYAPLVCIVLQGSKEVVSGAQTLEFAAGQSLFVGADMPVQGRVLTASAARPYLAISTDLDLALLRDIVGDMQGVDTAPGEPLRLIVSETDQQIADCLRRLAQIPERAEAQIILRPAILRELHYWLLHGRHGALVRRLARPEGHAQRIGRAVAVLRADFAQRLPVRELAEAAGMSASAFHQHFKEATTLTPLQFQKQLRLIEARRLILSGAHSVSAAAFDVGYESVSQFSRDYSRMFGASPRRDMNTRRDAA